MPKLKKLSGIQVLNILANFGFQVYSQKGSHLKLRRNGIKSVVTIKRKNAKVSFDFVIKSRSAKAQLRTFIH